MSSIFDATPVIPPTGSTSAGATRGRYRKLQQCIAELLACDWPGELLQGLAGACMQALVQQGFEQDPAGLTGVVRFFESSQYGLRVTGFVRDPLSGTQCELKAQLWVPLDVVKTGEAHVKVELVPDDDAVRVPTGSMELVSARSPRLLGEEQYLAAYVEHIRHEFSVVDEGVLLRVGRRVANALTTGLSH